MKSKLLLTIFTVVFSITAKAKNFSDPIVTVTPDYQTICPGNNAIVTFTGPANSILTISNPDFPPYTIVLNIGAAGMTTFITPVLYETTTYTLVNVKSFFTPNDVIPLGNTFTISVEPVPPPSGISPQTLYEGQTLADVVVTGSNIQWYDAPQGGNLLPITTVLQNGTTYYASQTIANCESRSVQTTRLAIVVQVNLGIGGFRRNAFNLYPNPTSNSIMLISGLSDVKLDIFTALGQKIDSKILENGTNTIDLVNFASGIYLFQLSLDGTTETFKIVKN